MPLANPDGYEYSHTTDRLWRKNRSGKGRCAGIDLNRNFGYVMHYKYRAFSTQIILTVNKIVPWRRETKCEFKYQGFDNNNNRRINKGEKKAV